MAYIDTGQGNMVWVPDGNAGHGGTGTGPGPSPSRPLVPVDMTQQTTVTANIAPEVAAMATQEDRGGVAGAATGTLVQLASISARLDKLEAVVAKLIT